MTLFAITGILALCVVAAALFTTWGHGPIRQRETVADAALRELYGRYRAEVGALTQTHLLQAPADEEWLAGIKAQVLASNAEAPSVLRQSTGAELPADRQLSSEVIVKLLALDEPLMAHAMYGDLPGGSTSPEGRYLAGPGKSAVWQITDLRARAADVAIKVTESQAAMVRAESTDTERQAKHRGGGRPWLLRFLIPAMAGAEAVTVYIAMQALVTTQGLAIGLAVVAALVGAGMACIIANRRLNQLPVPLWARLLEGVFVAVLTVLRYASLQTVGVGSLAPAGGAALAALISSLGLIGIEETVVETRTFSLFLRELQVSWKRWRYAAARARLARIRARLKTTTEKLRQHFLHFLLTTEGLPPGQAQSRAAALRVDGDYAWAHNEAGSTADRLVLHPNAGRHHRRRRMIHAAGAVVAAAAVVAAGFLIARPAGGAQQGLSEQRALALYEHRILEAQRALAAAQPPADRIAVLQVATEVVPFPHNQYVLTDPAKTELHPLTLMIKNMPAASITITGYTSSIAGSHAADHDLSWRRAHAVATYLEAHGVRASRLAVNGSGESAQLSEGITMAGHVPDGLVIVTVLGR